MVGWRVCLFLCLSLSLLLLSVRSATGLHSLGRSAERGLVCLLSLLLLSAGNSASLIFISWTGSLRMGRCLDLFVVDDVVVVVS